MRSRLLILAVLTACGLTGAAVALSTGGHSARPPGPRADRYLGPVSPGALVRFGLSLRMRDAALERYGQAVAAGKLPPLSAAEIGRRFGLPNGSLAGLRRELARAGVRIDEQFKQRTQLLVSAPAARVQQLLHVSLARFLDGSGAVYQRPLGEPQIPLPLRGDITAATHLDTKRIPMADAVPAGGVTAASLSAFYNLRPLVNQGLDGSGVTVAVFSMDTFMNSDIQQFDALHNIAGAPPIQTVQVEPGNPAQYVPGSEAGEVDLDLQVVQELAPKATIIDYQAPGGNPAYLLDGIDKIVSDGKAKLANFSYGICELLINSGQLRTADQSAFGAAEAAGVTAVVASGDQGAYECQRNDRTDHRLSVSWPASSPHVLAVGGTYVDLRQDGTRFDELGWEEILARAGGGGGVSTVFRQPTWQAGVSNRLGNGHRQVPDVAADAASASGYATVVAGQPTEVGGTSAAAPFWVGSLALVEELAMRRLGHALPFLPPLLYKIAVSDPQAFYDVKLGGNRYYRAGPGWDYSTGLGTPDIARLANDLIALARGH